DLPGADSAGHRHKANAYRGRRLTAAPCPATPYSRPSRSRFILGFEIELDLHVVGIAQEDLPARAVRHLVHAVGDALAGKVPLHGLEAAAAERDMIDDAGIRALLAVRPGDVVEVQDRMARAVEPGAGEIESRTRTVFESEHVLIESKGLIELACRHVIMVEHADAHVHGGRPPPFALGWRVGGYSAMRRPRPQSAGRKPA